MQLEGITKELSSTQELQTQFTAKIHDLEKENIVLKNRAEEVRLLLILFFGVNVYGL